MSWMFEVSAMRPTLSQLARSEPSAVAVPHAGGGGLGKANGGHVGPQQPYTREGLRPDIINKILKHEFNKGERRAAHPTPPDAIRYSPVPDRKLGPKGVLSRAATFAEGGALPPCRPKAAAIL